MTAYKRSKFTISLPIVHQGQAFIALYNTLTRAYVLLSPTQWEAVQKGDVDIITEPEITAQMMDQGILVPKHVEENAVFNHWRHRIIHDLTSLRSKVLVTRKCNLRCTYCIIDKESKEMSAQTVLEMDIFYLDRIAAKKPRQVYDDYLGGEPLLNTAAVLNSATRRHYFCKGLGIDYGFSITTNGTLVTPDIIAKLKDAGMTTIRVSLAGPAQIHNKLRPQRGGSGTYATILHNLAQISGLIPIHIEYQYDAGRNDFRRIPQMLADLAENHIEVTAIAFNPILTKRKANLFCTGVGDTEKFLFLKKLVRQHGLAGPDSAPTNICMADLRSTLVFDTDGSLIPCPALHACEMAYGNVRDGIDFTAESQLLACRLSEKCLQQCELLPLCMGGCRLQSLTLSGNFNSIDCHYNTYRYLLETYIRECAQTALENAPHAL